MNISTDNLRTQFTLAMSAMYQKEVPQYNALLTLVDEVNANSVVNNEQQKNALLSIERHGAIRLGTAEELSIIRRLFSVLGMYPVDYYDLSIAGIPVHSTAFRAIDLKSLKASPFRIFTSLLRIDLITDKALRATTKHLLEKRNIFSNSLMRLIKSAENSDGLTTEQAEQFINEAIDVFRWHKTATIDKNTYEKLSKAHGLIADVVSFRGPHINHLTPTTFDIDKVQQQLVVQGFTAKDRIEGPPLRSCPILLRQTSFIALKEKIEFFDKERGTHTARFGEIEQRGIALTPKGRDLYDQLLQNARDDTGDYIKNLESAFAGFPDSHKELREQGLAYYLYSVTSKPLDKLKGKTIEQIIDGGYLSSSPIIYEDFLPVSAAGIFQSNLSDCKKQEVKQSPNKEKFEKELGASVINSFSLYEKIQEESLSKALQQLGLEAK